MAKELYCPLLPKLGCNRNFPLLLRYNTSLLLGLALYDPDIEQGVSKIEVLLTHGASSSMTGKLLLTLYEQHQLEIGIFTPSFMLPYATYSKSTPVSWLVEIWEFTHRHKVELKDSDPVLPRTLREYDCSLINIFINEKDLSTQVVIALNRVCCYLQVLSLADIAIGDGCIISWRFLHGILGESTRKWIWHEERPEKNSHYGKSTYQPFLTRKGCLINLLVYGYTNLVTYTAGFMTAQPRYSIIIIQGYGIVTFSVTLAHGYIKSSNIV